MILKIPLILDPQPEGDYTVTSPMLPELITEGDTIAEAVANVEDALAAVVEIYEDEGRAQPSVISMDDSSDGEGLDRLEGFGHECKVVGPYPLKGNSAAHRQELVGEDTTGSIEMGDASFVETPTTGLSSGGGS